MKVISFKKQKKNIEKLDDVKFEKINVDKLYLAKYQRPLNNKRVCQYAACFDPDIFGIVLVSERDGKYWIIDGQHRVEVAKTLKIKTVWCQIIKGLTYEQEAEKFHLINDRKVRLNANHKFHARVEMQDTVALDIVDVLNKYGLDYSKEGGKAVDNTIGCVGTLEKIYKQYGLLGLNKTLLPLASAYNGNKESLRSAMIKGVSTFVHNWEYDNDFLIKVLEKIPPQSLMNKGMESTFGLHRVDEGNCYHIAKIIRDLYENMALKQYVKPPMPLYRDNSMINKLQKCASR